MWDGEFNEMEKAENRLLFIIPLSLGLVFILLYIAFHLVPRRDCRLQQRDRPVDRRDLGVMAH